MVNCAGKPALSMVLKLPWNFADLNRTLCAWSVVDHPFPRSEMKKSKIKTNTCVLMGLLSLLAAGGETQDFATQVIVTTSAGCLFALFFCLAIWFAEEEQKLKPKEKIKRTASWTYHG